MLEKLRHVNKAFLKSSLDEGIAKAGGGEVLVHDQNENCV